MAPRARGRSRPEPSQSTTHDPVGGREPSDDVPVGPSSTPRTLLGLFIALAIVVVAGTIGLMLLLTESTPSSDSAEAGFARDMQVHHAQAVEMALIVREKSNDPALRSVAYDIATGQEQQMGQMYAWLEMWGLPKVSRAKPMSWMKGMDHSTMSGASNMQMGLLPDGRMPGMASDADLVRLRQLEGKAAEVAFLRLMITHHEAGVMMADAALQKTEEPVVRRLATAIRSAQTSEIKTMRQMLTDRGVDPDQGTG